MTLASNDVTRDDSEGFGKVTDMVVVDSAVTCTPGSSKGNERLKIYKVPSSGLNTAQPNLCCRNPGAGVHG